MSSRRSRRRFERQRVKQGRTARPLTPIVRILVALAGLALIVAGGFLLTHPGSHNSARLPRVAGIMMLFGVVAIVAAVIGRL